ncbi:MAG: alpha/beta fold hydrolase [Phycisphaerae bacterium]
MSTGFDYEGMLASAAWSFVARNWALISIATTLVLLVVIPAVVIRKYVLVALNIIDDVAPPVWPESREAVPTEGESVSFSAFDGHALGGTMLPAEAGVPKKGAVIFAHEFGVDRWSCYRYALPLRRAGYEVFAFDFRGHGQSPGEKGYKPRQFPSDREQFDMLGAIGFVEDYLEHQGRPREVGLVGLSRGGGAAILASVGVESVKAIAVDGAFSSDTVLEYLLKKWACIFAKLRVVYENHPPAFWRFLRWRVMVQAEKTFHCHYPSVRNALRRIGDVPIFFIHGERDTYIPVEQAQILYSQAVGPKYLWTVPGARHNQSVNVQPEEYGRRLAAFFDRHLAGCDSPAVLDHAALSDLSQPLGTEESAGVARVEQRIL